MSKFSLKLEKFNCVHLKDVSNFSLVDVFLTETVPQVAVKDFVLTIQAINFSLVNIALFKAVSARNVVRSFKQQLLAAIVAVL